MDVEELRSRQAPLKELYRNDAESAKRVLQATAIIDPDDIACSVETSLGIVRAGLHHAVGGLDDSACSGDMLLQALVACAGVTLGAVAKSLGIEIRSGVVIAEGDLDFRGTLGVNRDTPVGFSDVRLRFEIDTDATDEQSANLLRLTERYCVIYQTLKNSPRLSSSITNAHSS